MCICQRLKCQHYVTGVQYKQTQEQAKLLYFDVNRDLQSIHVCKELHNFSFTFPIKHFYDVQVVFFLFRVVHGYMNTL